MLMFDKYSRIGPLISNLKSSSRLTSFWRSEKGVDFLQTIVWRSEKGVGFLQFRIDGKASVVIVQLWHAVFTVGSICCSPCLYGHGQDYVSIFTRCVPRLFLLFLHPSPLYPSWCLSPGAAFCFGQMPPTLSTKLWRRIKTQTRRSSCR